MSQIAKKSSSSTSSSGSSARNVIINGNMDFSQRTSTVTAATASIYTYCLDRFATFNSMTTHDAEPIVDAPTVTQSGFSSKQCLGVNNSTSSSVGASDLATIRYIVEGDDYQSLHGQQARLQFWAKCSQAGTYSVALQNAAGNRAYVTNYTLATNTWKKITIDLTLDTTGTWNFNTSGGLYIYFNQAVGSSLQTSTLNAWQATGSFGSTTDSNTFQTAGVSQFQLVQVMITLNPSGIIAPSMNFQRAGNSISDELSLCLRYFEKSYQLNHYVSDVSEFGIHQTLSILNASNRLIFSHDYQVRKRIAPTVTYYSPTTGASGVVSFTTALGSTSDIGASSGGTTDITDTVDLGNSGTAGQPSTAAFQYYADSEY